MPGKSSLAESVVVALVERGWTLATGESLTAGLVAAAVADVAGASAVLRGGVVAYDEGVKAAMLGVSEQELSAGVVSSEVAIAMARGARERVGADVGIGTTGVAGPKPHGGQPVGSVWIAVAIPDGVSARHLSLTGDREAIRAQTVDEALTMLLAELAVPGRE